MPRRHPLDRVPELAPVRPHRAEYELHERPGPPLPRLMEHRFCRSMVDRAEALHAAQVMDPVHGLTLTGHRHPAHTAAPGSDFSVFSAAWRPNAPDGLVTFVSMFESPDVLDGLNDEQRQAVVHPGGPLLVLAGAGTGKTRTLVARAAWLCDQGVEPSRILLLTFTRRAADDMLSRAAGCAQPANGRITGGTFQAIAHRIIRRHAELVPGDDGIPPTLLQRLGL